MARQTKLDSKRAVLIAKRWVADQFEPERIEAIGLEELKFERGRWLITIGFHRPAFDRDPKGMNEQITASFNFASPGFDERVFKVIVVSDASGEVVEMQNREAA